MTSSLDHDPTLPHYWSEHPRDKAIRANCNALSSKFTGISICHPIYHENTMYLATRHAIYSAALSTEATSTLMFLPSWNKRMTNNPYASLYRRFPHICKFSASYHHTNSKLQKYPSEQYTDAPSQTHLGSAYHCHMEY